MDRRRDGQALRQWTGGMLTSTLVAGALVAGLLAGCARTPASAEAAPANPAVASAEAPPEVKGRLEPRRFAALGVSTPGRIESVAVQEGERVESGAVLFRLEGSEGVAAEAAAAESERVEAQQALDALFRNAGMALAESTVRLRQAEKALALAEDRLHSLQKPKEQQLIDQAHANLLLAEKRLADSKEDLRKAQQKYANKNHIIWMFTNRRQFRLQLALLEKGVAAAERRYWDARQKHADLLAPVDEIDLAIAQAELAAAQAQARQEEQERAKLAAGPDPEQVEASQARLRASEARLAAAHSALEALQITAPFSGVVVKLEAKAGEWALPGVPLAVVADLSAWVVESGELDEADAPDVEAGQPVHVSLDAYPELRLQGLVEWVSLYSEDDEGEVYYRVRIELADAPPGLRWGMTARVREWGFGTSKGG